MSHFTTLKFSLLYKIWIKSSASSFHILEEKFWVGHHYFTKNKVTGSLTDETTFYTSQLQAPLYSWEEPESPASTQLSCKVWIYLSHPFSSVVSPWTLCFSHPIPAPIPWRHHDLFLLWVNFSPHHLLCFPAIAIISIFRWFFKKIFCHVDQVFKVFLEFVTILFLVFWVFFWLRGI